MAALTKGHARRGNDRDRPVEGRRRVDVLDGDRSVTNAQVIAPRADLCGRDFDA